MRGEGDEAKKLPREIEREGRGEGMYRKIDQAAS